MTDKKENILKAALELFASIGFDACSTSRIARTAGVSEGLIFRHFGNKKGLLDAIMQEAEQRIQQMFAHILFETDPREVILKTVRLPFQVEKSEYDFWTLQYKLKWQDEYNKPEKMKPVLDKLIWAFSELGYEQPELEAIMLNQILEAISIGALRDGIEPSEAYQSFLLQKYR